MGDSVSYSLFVRHKTALRVRAIEAERDIEPIQARAVGVQEHNRQD